MLARWLAIFPAAAAVLAQTAPQPAKVSGTVTNSVTGEPILRAHVTAHCMSEDRHDGPIYYGALTNQKGEFSLAQLPSGNCSLEVKKVGFVAPQRGENYSLASGAKKEGVKLTLIPAGAITGRVLGSGGEPAQGIAISAELAIGASGNTTSDDRGQFRIGGLGPGKYRVKATPQSLPFPPEIRADGTVELHDSATYFPGSLDAKTAQRLDVKAGAEVSGVEIKLLATPVVRVSGTVTGIPAGAKNVMVNITPSGQGAGVKADGTFSIWRLDPGKYTVQAQQWANQLQFQSAPIEIEVTGTDVEHLELRVIPPFEVAGQLRLDDDKAGAPPEPPARPNGTAPPASPPQPRTVQLLPVVDRNVPGANVGVGADDTFTLEKVQPVRYRVTISGVSGYVKSIRAGERESDGDTLDLRSGAPGPVTVTLSSNYCEVSGTVSDSAGPVADAAVVLVPAEVPGDARTARSNADGSYHFRIAPGKYKLAAVESGTLSWGFDGPDLEEYEPESLELSAGDKISKNLVQRK